ncbi:MAG: hypothetical protein WCD76_13380 [Pyrinomonadaceae bacterium]
MTVASFIPQLWAASLLTGLHKNLVYAQEGIVDRQYEGVIAAQGDVVNINFIGGVSVFDVDSNADIPDPEPLSTAATKLTIDQAKGFNFAVDDIDKRQAAGDIIETAMSEASYGVRDKADSFLAGLYTDAASANLIGSDTTPIVPTADTAYDYLVDLDVLLDEANVPTGGRWVVIPAWFRGLLRKDKRFVQTGTMAGDVVRATGEIGEVANLKVLQSNNVRNTNQTKYKIMAGHKMAWNYADQIISVEAFRMEKRFSDAVKGLHVYGGKVVRPQAMAVLTANRS